MRDSNGTMTVCARVIPWLTLLLILVGPSARATFSIAAVDPATGQVGSAGASCIAGSIILSDVHPGVGTIHTQSFWNGANQAFARNLMNQGASPQEIIDALVANDAQNNPSVRQYGVVDLVDGGRSAAFTGSNCIDFKGHELGMTYAIAGNILLGQEVLDAMEQAFLTTPGTLADRMMAALQGANIPGADTRCLPNKPALSAFLRVAQPDDPTNDLWLDLNVNNTSSNQNPIDILQGLYDDWVGQVAVPDGGAPPIVMYPARPNPFQRATTVAFELESSGWVTVRVFDSVGRRVADLLDATRAAGRVSVDWGGDGVPAGVYWIRIDAGDRRATSKVVLTR